MKTTLIALACLIVAPLAFGQAGADDKTSGPITYKKEDPYKMGTIASYEPGRSITINSTIVSHPVRYVVAPDAALEKQGGGAVARESITPGTKVSLEFDSNGQVDRITLLDLR